VIIRGDKDVKWDHVAKVMGCWRSGRHLQGLGTLEVAPLGCQTMNEGPKARPLRLYSGWITGVDVRKRACSSGWGPGGTKFPATLTRGFLPRGRVTYREKPQKTGKLRDFEFSPRPPEVDPLQIRTPVPT